MRIDLKPVARLDDDERAALKTLTATVYPPEVVAVSPGRHIQWASPDSSVLVFTPEGELVSHVGLVVRLGTLSPRGERAVLTVPLDTLMRVSSNPFFPYLASRLTAWMDQGTASASR